MKISNKILDILFMMRDFTKILIGKSYFHLPDRLGSFFDDGKSYYIDFKPKVKWEGKWINNLPAVYFPYHKNYLLFPATILQYGLGSLDRYFLKKNKIDYNNADNVYRWILSQLENSNFIDNHFDKILNLHTKYISNNSAMTSGMAISFLTRIYIIKTSEEDRRIISNLVSNIYKNMTTDLHENGSSIIRKNDIYFLEYCRPDNYLVLNGWIFSILGIYDYFLFTKEKDDTFQKALNTLENNLSLFIMDNGWTYYDNQKRISSPIYQFTHITLFEIMFKITKRKIYKNKLQKIKKAYNLRNKVFYTINKIKDKLYDKVPYTTVH